VRGAANLAAAKAANQLIGLLASTSARTREIIMSSLIRGGWIEPAQDKT
jgi:hypothetical protein